MRQFVVSLSLGLFFILAPLSAHAATANFLGPIISPECNCPGGATGIGCVMGTAQNTMNFGISISIVIAVLIIAYAGILLVFNATNPENRAKARSILINAVVGIVIVLAAWLVVDFVMRIFYNPNSQFGPWNNILTGGAQCIQPVATKSLFSGPPINAVPTTGGGTPTTGGGGVTGAQCSVSNTACNVSSLQADGLTSGQANAMSCIAVTESSGNPSQPPYNTVHPGSNSSACGTFQVTKSTWNGTATGACSDFSNCTNASCNEQVAAALVEKSGYSSWTCPGCNNKAAACVSKYDSGG